MQVEMYKSLGFMGYPDYMVSRSGKVLSKNYGRSGKEKVLKQQKNNKGYLYVDLYKDKKQEHFLVHRLVALAWIPNPDNLPFINHKDETPLNNSVFNLEWCDCKYNINYGTSIQRRLETLKTSEKWKEGQKRMMETRKTSKKYKKGRKSSAEKHSKKVYQYTKDGDFVREWLSCREVGRNGFQESNVSNCCRGKQKTHKGFIWSYERLE